MADENANIIFGAVIDETLEGVVRITVLATGFGEAAQMQVTNKEEHTEAVSQDKTQSNMRKFKSQSSIDPDIPLFLRDAGQ